MKCYEMLVDSYIMLDYTVFYLTTLKEEMETMLTVICVHS